MSGTVDAEDALREMLRLGDCGNGYRSAVEAVLGLIELLRKENEALEVKISNLGDDVLEHKDACGHLRAALVGRGQEIDALKAENAKLRQKDSEAAGTLRANVAETQLVEAMDEIERLRAENAKLGKKLECKRVRIEAMQANWSAERERTEADRQSADKLRANIAETQLVGAMEELDWFRRRDQQIEAQADTRHLGAQLLTGYLAEYERANPKPGAGT